jgi:hypothetical protein
MKPAKLADYLNDQNESVLLAWDAPLPRPRDPDKPSRTNRTSRGKASWQLENLFGSKQVETFSALKTGLLGCAFNRSAQHRLKSIGWRFEAQGLSRSLIEPQSNRVQIALRDAREVGPSREVLTQQAVGVLV